MLLTHVSSSWRMFSVPFAFSVYSRGACSSVLYSSVRGEHDTVPPLAGDGFNVRTPDACSTASTGGPTAGSAVTASLRPKLRALLLHNMPRSWMYEEIVEFIHQVAEHAGIEAPSTSCVEGGCEGDETDSAVPGLTSSFLARVHIPFGRRTGITYGTPTLLVTSDALADYLLHNLILDPDDYRSRIYFTETAAEGRCNGFFGLPSMDEEAAVQAEQRQALSTLELDRYLLAPDLLYDIAKMRQRRLVTRRSRLLLHTFADDEGGDRDAGNGDIGGDVGDDNDTHEERGNGEIGNERKKNQRKQMTLKCAGDYKDLGRGSMHSIPLPVPYVRGRRGT